MKTRSFTVITILIGIILWGGGIFFYQKKDRTAPEITINESGLIYEEGMEEAQLYGGVSAWDSREGNLDHKIIIEKIVTDEGKQTAVITYGVSDEAGNVGKRNRQVSYLVPQEELPQQMPLPQESETVWEMALQEEEEPEVIEEEGGEVLEETEEPESREERQEEEERQEPESQEEPQEEPVPEPEPLPRAGEAAEGENVRNTQNSVSPTLTFKEGRVKTSRGMNPAWVQVIGSLTDDKDDYGALFGTLQIQGEYDPNTVGDYAVTVTVRDSDGNESVPVPITIEVQE